MYPPIGMETAEIELFVICSIIFFVNSILTSFPLIIKAIGTNLTHKMLIIWEAIYITTYTIIDANVVFIFPNNLVFAIVIEKYTLHTNASKDINPITVSNASKNFTVDTSGIPLICCNIS